MTATLACVGSRPVANAFGALSLMMYTLGIGTPAASDSSWTTLMSCGASPGPTCRAWEAARTSPSPPNHAPALRRTDRIRAPTTAPAAPVLVPVMAYPITAPSSTRIPDSAIMSSHERRLFCAICW